MIITNNALTYLMKSINLNKKQTLMIYLSINYPFTKHVSTSITFCEKKHLKKNDVKIKTEKLDIYVEKKSINHFENAIIDFKNNTLLIKAPNLYIKKKKNESIKNQIKQLFETEINSILSQHGGFVELMETTNDEITIKFHGGCQGCSMAGYTLNNYIKKTIKKHFPEIKKINDITLHHNKNNSFY